MKKFIIILVIMVLMENSDSQHSSCAYNCPSGKIPLSVLSYRSIRSHVFNGARPSNNGCIDDASSGGQNINCGLGAALLDCNSDFNGGDFLDLSTMSINAWSRASLSSNVVSIVFRFTQQSSISVIRMFFWNSTSDNINVPSVNVYSSDSSITQSATFSSTSYSINGSENGSIMTINLIGNQKFHYLRITMNFLNNRGWIFLSEIQFCGTTANFHITQPPTEDYKQRISSTATMASVTCALNTTISANIVVLWTHNGNFFTVSSSRSSNSETLLIRNLQSSDLGDYECAFIDTNNLWRIRRVITLVVETECNGTSVPSNGEIVSCSSGTLGIGFEGDTCSFTCNTGYELTGSDIRTCQSDGSWSGNDTVCRQVTCPLLDIHGNDTIMINCSLGDDGVPSYKDTCSFTCNAGYELTGSNTRTCQRDGSWSGNSTVCRQVTCSPFTDLENGAINCSLGDDGASFPEDTCSFTCNTGYELTGSGTRTCQSDKSWSGSDALCKRVSCPRLSNPNNSLVNCSLGDDGAPSYEDTCSFTCSTGYELTGSNSRTCQSNRNWSGSNALCRRVSCPALTNPSNAVINCLLGDDGILSYEDTCTFTCDVGYKLISNDSTTVTCQSNGSWSDRNMVCARVSCMSLTGPVNGTMNCSLGDDKIPSYEDTCSFTCNDGYEFSGSDTRTCQNDGSWNGSNAVCIKVICQMLTNMVNGAIDCSLGDDGIPSYGDTCSFTCETGFKLTGSDTRTCQSNGNWSGNTAICKEVQCPPPINSWLNCPSGAAVGSIGETCKISCRPGFGIGGSTTEHTTGMCLANQSWSNNPICAPRNEIQCMPYEPQGICKGFLSQFDHPVKIAINTSLGIGTIEQTADLFYTILTSRLPVHKQCLDVLLPYICRWIFSTCDPAYNESIEQYTCRRTCEIFTNFVCNEVWLIVISQLENLNFLGANVPVCDGLERANGGDVPDCIDALQGGEIPVFSVTGDCFTGHGRGYNGTINVTKSGKTCQRWSEQAPHQFILPSSQYPEIVGDHNYCRNPGSRAPDGPWCFTTDPNTRWEYCDVPKCEPSPSCELYYNTSDGICFKYGSIGMDYVFLNNSVDNQNSLNSKLVKFNDTLHGKVKEGFPPECIDIILELMCHNSFPLCDYSSDTPVPRKVCRSYCEAVQTGKCESIWRELDALSSLAVIKLPDCETLPSPEAGDYLECFIPYNNGRNRRDINTTECYTKEDLGIRYNGTVNVTNSGRTCQPWDSNTPHYHPITSLHRYYLEDHNYCRNPEGRGKHPWCYTTDPNMRWEYCNVPNCSSIIESTPAISNTSESNGVVIGLSVVIPILLILLLVLIVFIFVLRRAARKKQQVHLPYPLKPNVTEGNDSCVNNEYFDPKLLNYEKLPNVPRENITYISDLGEGNFGVVMKGEAKDVVPKEPSTLVAIKVLKEGSNKDARNDFVKEAIHMNQFNHPNILKLLGVCFDKEPLCLLFEYMDLGDLNSYLRRAAVSSSHSSSTLTVQQLTDMAVDIAAGLEYLALHHFVHRDLATRNCLINEKLLVKISDFGLSKDIYCKDYYKLGEKSVMPIRWMPPEAILFSTFTTQSDIWSFGIVLWEIFSSGTQPYCALSNEEVVDRVTNGQILRCPSGCPKELYALMVNCWATEPKERPTATEVYAELLKCTPNDDTTKEPLNYVIMKPTVTNDDAAPNQLDETPI